MFVGYVLEAVRSADPRGGYDAVDTPWHGVPSVDPPVEEGLGTLHTSFGAVSDTPAESPCGWNPNRR